MENRKFMAKILDIIGLALIVIMFLAFVGAIPQVGNGLSATFWICAGGVLMIIVYRKRKQKQAEKEN